MPQICLQNVENVKFFANFCNSSDFLIEIINLRKQEFKKEQIIKLSSQHVFQKEICTFYGRKFSEETCVVPC